METTEIIVVEKEEKEDDKKKNKKFLKIRKFLKKIPWKDVIIIGLFLLMTYFSMELLNGNNVSFVTLLGREASLSEKKDTIIHTFKEFFKCPKFIGNFILLISIYIFFFGLTNKIRVSCSLVSILIELFSIMNYVVTQIRGIAITISDVYSIQTAMNVAKGMSVEFDGNFIVGVLIFLISNLLLWSVARFKDKKIKTPWKKVITSAIGVAGVVFVFCFPPIINDVAIWDINASYANSGAGLTLMRLIKDYNVQTPNDYNIIEVQQLLSEYEDDTEEYDSKEFPNVLVIMNESFADLEDLFNYESSEDNITYFHQLMNEENVVSGTMHSSQYGGGTANVEYEFLTENTTAFLPKGSMPYQQYVTKTVNQSIVSYMNKLGYNTYGIHSWNKNGYSRGKIYRFLQFQNYMFREDMPELEINLSNYSSDKSTYKYYYNIMNNKPEGENNFTFIVTVQNHLPFTHIDENGIQYVEDNTDLNSYLQYESMSDEALEELIEYLKNYEEDVILLFFGDHQPNLSLEEKYGSTGEYSVEESSYVVPFFIWANYDIEEKSGIETSTNYLANLLLDVADIPKDSYTQYVSEVSESIPVITTQYYIGNDGVRYDLEDTESPYYEKLQEYWKVIYYEMFDNN